MIEPLSAGNGKYYVYCHHRISDGGVFYVGKGTRRRAWLVSGRSDEWRQQARSGFLVNIIVGGMSNDFALFSERVVIGILGIGNLANKTMGGGGAEGFRHSDTWKSILSDRMKGARNPMSGRTGEKNPFFGKTHSPDTKLRMRGKRDSVSGVNNPSADRSVYTFCHKDFGALTGTRFDLASEIGVNTKSLSKIFTRGSYRGWVISDGK